MTNQPKGGFDVEFVKVYPDDNVTCSICLFVLREPMQAIECGHRFCKDCVADLKKSGDSKYICPEDRSKMNLFPDKGKEREILGRKVKCPNFKDGCSVVKDLRLLEVHQEECDYKMVQCVVGACSQRFQQQYYDQHYKNCCYRFVNCIFCDDEYIFAFEQEHIDACDEFLECCDFCVAGNIPRSKMEDHLVNNCKMIPHPCGFASIGCQEKVLLEDLGGHHSRSIEHHLNLAMDKITTQQQEISSLKNSQAKLLSRFEKFEKKADSLTLNELHVWKVSDFTEKLDKAKGDEDGLLLDEDFYTAQGYKLRCSLQDSNTPYIGVFFKTTKGVFDDALNWPLKLRIKFLIEKQEKKHVVLTHTHSSPKSFEKPPNKNSPCGFRDVLSISDIAKFLTNDTLTVRIRTKLVP